VVSATPKSHQTEPGTDTLVEAMYQRSIFLNMALNMTWQLAIVFLVPIVGGFELDKHLKTTPWLTITGAVVAMLGTLLILRQTLKRAAVRTSVPKKGVSR
jgi:F0F1-type ATP synthase assembly protein I